MYPASHDDDTKMTGPRRFVLVLTIALTVCLLFVDFPQDPPRLAEIALERMPESGVENPVTAVLLNFRGHDTLLEVAVLLLAVIGIWSIARSARVWIQSPASPVLAVFVRFLLPLMVVIAGYLLWLGADAPGGAFQGGAVLGGMGILLIATAAVAPHRYALPVLRILTVLGVVFFVLAGVGLLWVEGNFLQYPPGQAKALILIIETAATISIGITLALLFIGGTPKKAEDQ